LEEPLSAELDCTLAGRSVLFDGAVLLLLVSLPEVFCTRVGRSVVFDGAVLLLLVSLPEVFCTLAGRSVLDCSTAGGLLEDRSVRTEVLLFSVDGTLSLVFPLVVVFVLVRLLLLFPLLFTRLSTFCVLSTVLLLFLE